MSFRKFLSLAILINPTLASIDNTEPAALSEEAVTSDVAVAAETSSTSDDQVLAVPAAVETAPTAEAPAPRGGLQRLRSSFLSADESPRKKAKASDELGDCQVCGDAMTSADTEQHAACSQLLHKKCAGKWRFRQTMEGKPSACPLCRNEWPIDGDASSLTAEERREIELSVKGADDERKAEEEAASVAEARRVQDMMDGDDAQGFDMDGVALLEHIQLMIALQQSMQPDV